MRHLLSLFAFLACVCVVTTTASAQYRDSRSPGNQYVPTPSVSPYMELLRGGAGPALNFETLVRPQIELRDQQQNQRVEQDRILQRQQQINQQQQQQVQALQQQQFIRNPFTLPLADPLTGAAQSIRPTGQGRPISYSRAITGHPSSRLRLQRSTGQPYFAPITGRGGGGGGR